MIINGVKLNINYNLFIIHLKARRLYGESAAFVVGLYESKLGLGVLLLSWTMDINLRPTWVDHLMALFNECKLKKKVFFQKFAATFLLF